MPWERWRLCWRRAGLRCSSSVKSRTVNGWSATVNVTDWNWMAASWAWRIKLKTSLTLDLMGEYKFNEKVVLKVNLTNALDKLYADGLYTSFYTPGPGRNLQATLNLKF